MNTIYKYKIPVGGDSIAMPEGAKILSVGVQGDSLMLWAEVNPHRKKYPRQVEVFGTGHEIHSNMWVSREFIGTVFMSDLVWHVYERTN